MEKLVSPENIRPIKKLFIAQRGEIALRAAQTCEKRGMAALIPYTFSDFNPIASRMVVAHQSDGWELIPLPGTGQEQNFTNGDRILAAARSHGCDAIFLGHGFLSENAEFVKQCEKVGMRVLAPPSRVMEATGNKINARRMARETKIGRFATIPVVEGSDDVKTFEDAVRAVSHLTYPVMVKDPDLGGGSGNLVARDEKELEAAFKTLKGRPDNRQLFLERYIEQAIHVEVQIVADRYGNVVSLGERDCTMQRRNQKIIEEAPSPQISPRLRNLLQIAAVNFAKKIGYQGVGTWEFIIDRARAGRGGDPAWYFMEVNPRIQVEHRVTEAVTKANGVNVDIAGLMLDIAEGRPLPFTQSGVKIEGHAIEIRHYAENPDRNFEPTFGKVTVLKQPQVPGVTVAAALEEGDSLSQWYDHTIALYVAKGEDREDARSKLVRAGLETEVAGVSSNLPFGIDLLNSPEFRQANVFTRFVEEYHRKRLRERIDSDGLLNTGTVSIQTPSLRFKPELMLQDTTVIRGKTPVSYTQYLEKVKQRTGKDCAAEYEIIERDGLQYVVYDLDFGVDAGTIGVQEGNVFEDACQLAHQKHLPLVTVCRSGGARQWENVLALFQMGRMVAALNRFPPKIHFNVYAGPVYGGVPASFAGVADIEMAINSPGVNIGFTGPYIVARAINEQPTSFSASDAYKVLPVGTHSPVAHYEDRNIHILADSVESAGDIISHVIHVLSLREAIVDPNYHFQAKEEASFRESYGRAMRYDRPGRRSPAWIGRVGEFFVDSYRTVIPRKDASVAPLSTSQRMQILQRGDRPTAADLLDPRMGLVDDARLLSSPPFLFEGVEQYPSIIAAVAQIDNIPVFVLGQQTRRVYDTQSKTWEKKYDPQKPEDWEYGMHMLGVASKLRLPLLLLGDTKGADCAPESESKNQSHKIAQFIKWGDLYPCPVLSGLIGMKGSGGGETFIRPFDFAFDAQNALSFVAEPMVQNWILTNKWIDETASDEQKEELRSYIEQLEDATAEGRLKLQMIDAIISEGVGGAHLNPQLFARNIRQVLAPQLKFLLEMPERDLKDRRYERIFRVSSLVSVPFSS